MFILEKWWVIEGVKNPVYVGLTRKPRGYYGVASLVLILLILVAFFLESSGFVPSGLSLTIIMTSFLVEFLFRIFGWRRKILSKSDIVYIKNLVKILGKRIVKWCIPSYKIPLVLVLDNNVHLILFYKSYNLNIVLLKPIIYRGVVSGKPRLDLKWKERFRRDRFTRKGVCEIVFPHPEIPNVNYRASAKTIYFEIVIENNDLLKMIDEFDKYFESKGEQHVYPSNRRHTYPGQSFKHPGETVRKY